MRAIVSGGGSGGHIYPAIAIADKIREKDPSSEILYIGNDIGIEKDIVPKTGYPFTMVEARWFEKNPIELLKTGVATFKGYRQALKIMKKFKPDVVVGTGGFVCVPVVHAGHRYGARCYIHEQNAYPGVANRSLEKYVDNIFLGFEDASHYFKDRSKIIYTGNPVRRRFFNIDKDKCREKLGIDKDKFVIFVFAGSQGSNRVTDVMLEFIKMINGSERTVLLFATGDLHYEETFERLRADGVEPRDNIRIKAYIDNIQDYLGSADLVIGRAGALSVSEICICRRASILVPSPNVTGNHQYFNAKSVTDRGGAVLVEEKDFTAKRIASVAKALMDAPDFRMEMEQAAYNCAKPDATDRIYSIISGKQGETI